MVNEAYFYSMVTFLVLSTVIILVYIFLSVYMRNIYKKIEEIDNKLGKLKKK